MKKNEMLKVAIPVLILALIGGMWFVKNGMTGKHAETVKSDMKKESGTAKGDGEETRESSSEKTPQEATPAAGEPDFTFEITDKFDFDGFKKYGLPIIADYGSERCGPCVAMHPDLEAIHEEYKGKAFVKYADVWNHPSTAENVPVRVTPTQVLVTADGKPFTPSEDLQKEIGGFSMYNDKTSGEHVITVHEGMLSQEDFRKILKEMGVK